MMCFLYIFIILIRMIGFYPNLIFAQIPEQSPISKEERNKFEQKSEHYYQSVFRRLAFPPGTFLIFEPELTLPVWRGNPISRRSVNAKVGNSDYLTCGGGRSSRQGLDEDDDVSAITNSDIQISSPFYVYFDKLGWTHEDSIYNSHHRVAAPYLQNYFINPLLNLFGVPPPPTNAKANFGKEDDPIPNSNSKSNRMPLSDSHRLSLFHKIEKLLEEIGAPNGKACLLRAICELHEFPFDSGRFGMLGEVLALILGSIPKEDGNSCMRIYAKAESSGKQRDCLKYSRHCQHSIFQWYWKVSRNGLNKLLN